MRRTTSIRSIFGRPRVVSGSTSWARQAEATASNRCDKPSATLGDARSTSGAETARVIKLVSRRTLSGSAWSTWLAAPRSPAGIVPGSAIEHQA